MNWEHMCKYSMEIAWKKYKIQYRSMFGCYKIPIPMEDDSGYRNPAEFWSN